MLRTLRLHPHVSLVIHEFNGSSRDSICVEMYGEDRPCGEQGVTWSINLRKA